MLQDKHYSYHSEHENLQRNNMCAQAFSLEQSTFTLSTLCLNELTLGKESNIQIRLIPMLYFNTADTKDTFPRARD